MEQLLNISTQNASTLTMSSREIAGLINKNHSDLCRSIERLIAKGVIWGYQPTAYTHPQNGQVYYEYHLNKRDSLVVVAQNCPEFTAAIVDRWQELENQQKHPALPDFTNPAEAAREWAKQFEQRLLVEKQKALVEKQVDEMRPKAEFVDRYVEFSGSKSLRETAKILKMPEREMINRLVADKVLYRQSNNLLPYQKAHIQELFTVKTGITDNGYDFTQTRVTAKGIQWIANRYASELMS
ncbi:phage antirepressor KilAC domain-containing protein [Aggregatibacter kilianii]|uniref:phage antirepressor KilAC domain-containing protein n=1 Tax=Aggregatibacter kilianii TaxID=2025884 RepID=UPI0028D8DFBB|nr:phage antirepressor KilAC domain-containing protein [Aggregatibacter kilianii]